VILHAGVRRSRDPRPSLSVRSIVARARRVPYFVSHAGALEAARLDVEREPRRRIVTVAAAHERAERPMRERPPPPPEKKRLRPAARAGPLQLLSIGSRASPPGSLAGKSKRQSLSLRAEKSSAPLPPWGTSASARYSAGTRAVFAVCRGARLLARDGSWGVGIEQRLVERLS
jgi:hypothetical protein